MDVPFHESQPEEARTTEYALSVWTRWGLRTIKYTDPDRLSGKPILLCVPGVARTGRDFNRLAQSARPHFRVVCVTLLGMGTSDRLPSAADYRTAGWDLHINSIVTVMSYLGAQRVTYIGTSLGGIFGIILAAQRNSPISALVLNDVGAFAARENFMGFNEALASDVRFKNIEHAEKFLRIAFRTIGPLSADEWREFTLDSIEPGSTSGQYRLSYDLNIARQFLDAEKEDLDLWRYWNRVTCPALILRGKDSRFLNQSTMTEMLAIHRKSEGVTFPDCGHFPHLRSKEHTIPIVDWLVRQRLGDAGGDPDRHGNVVGLPIPGSSENPSRVC